MNTNMDDGRREYKGQEPVNPVIIIADWLDQGLVAMGNSRSTGYSQKPSLRENVFLKYNDWLNEISIKLRSAKLLGVHHDDSEILDIVNLFKYEGKELIPRQDQIRIFAAITGINLHELTTPAPGLSEPDIITEENGGMRFRRGIGVSEDVVHRILINQIKQQRPDAVISESHESTFPAKDVPPDNLIILEIKTPIPGVVAKFELYGRSITRENAHGLPLIRHIRLSFSPELLDKLAPLSREDYAKYTHFIPSQKPGQNEQQGRQNHTGYDAGFQGSTPGRSRSETGETDNFDPMEVGKQIANDPKWSDIDFDYTIFGFKRGMPFTAEQLTNRYRDLVKYFHQDTNPDLNPDILKRINVAKDRMEKKTTNK